MSVGATFAEVCGIHDEAREAAAQHTARLIEASGVELVRFGWCDLHGVLRGKTLTANAAIKALRAGVGMVSTLLLKTRRTAPPSRCSSPAARPSCRALRLPAT